MRTRIALICVAILSVLFIACPMPQVGVGKSKSTLDSGDQSGAQSTAGTISVINDTVRNQAVYINETGVHFDVVAPEYPGGPPVACVEVDAFTMVPPSTDADALPVKALVTGMRDDGTPGVWEIHADDTIDVPQPEQTDDNTARCIVGGDMTSLPNGVQIQFGWSFQTVAVSTDGRMIIGKAVNKQGATIGGVQILPNSPIGVYWRVYSLPYTRYCIVSAPRIIGTFTPQTLPPKWRTSGHPLTDLLRQLKLFFTGTLASYLTQPSSVQLEVPAGVTAAAAESAGAYIVTGLDEFSLPAQARIDKNSNITLAETLPDLELGVLQVPASPQDISASWAVNAALTNTGDYDAKSVTLSYYLSTSSVFSTSDSTVTKPIGTPLTFDTIAMGATVSGTTSISTTVAQVGFSQAVGTTVTYYVYAVVSAVPAANFNLDLGTSASGSFTVTNAGVTAPPETVKVTLSTDRVAAVHLLTDRWSFGITVAYSGAGTGGSIDVSATNDAATSLATSVIQTITIPNVSKDTPFTTTLSDPVSALGQLPGLYHVTITAHVGSATDSATCAVPVYYDLFVIDTYDPSTTFASGANVIDLFGPAGDTSTLDGLSGFNLWAQGGTLVSAALASDDGSAPARPVTSDYSGSGFAYAQFAGGIEPGKTYYIRSRMVNFSATMGYAIRILTAPGATYSTADMSVSIPSAGTTDDPAPLGGLGVPGGSQNPAASVNPIALGQAQGKMLSAGGVHWFKVILP